MNKQLEKQVKALLTQLLKLKNLLMADISRFSLTRRNQKCDFDHSRGPAIISQLLSSYQIKGRSYEHFLIVPTLEQVSGISEVLEDRINAVITDSSDRFMLPGRNGCLVKFNGIST